MTRFAFPFLLGAFVLGGDWCATSPGNEFCLFKLCPGRTNGQTAACKAFVACFEKTNGGSGGGSVGSLDSTFGPEGTCWNSSPAAVDACNSSCLQALSSMSGC